MIINQDIYIAAQYSADGKGFKKVNNRHEPWESTSEFLSGTPLPARHEGMIGYVKNGGSVEIWQFVGGFDDENLTKFESTTIQEVFFYNSVSDFPSVGVGEKIYADKSDW